MTTCSIKLHDVQMYALLIHEVNLSSGSFQKVFLKIWIDSKFEGNLDQYGTSDQRTIKKQYISVHRFHRLPIVHVQIYDENFLHIHIR